MAERGRIEPAKAAPPCTLVIFGGAGDLTKRLLMPSLYNLRVSGLLPDGFAVLGVDGSEGDDEDYRRDLGEAVRSFASSEVEDTQWSWIAERVHFLHGDFDDDGSYDRLGRALSDLEGRWRTAGNVLFYLATPPTVFAMVSRHLGKAGLLAETDGHWRRIVVEKPFGTDLHSARELNATLLEAMSEHQIYRMDHFLGKETVQNIMALRFANGLFEPIWNRTHIDHVQISVAETVAVERRGKFYDATGALRDMVPNHLFQLLAMTAMEPPNSFHADAVRTEKEKVLDAVVSLHPEHCKGCAVRAQYAAGTVKGDAVPDYREEPGVDPQSMTETYIAMRLMLDTWRWAGVPFYLRTGKAMARRKTEIAIKFKHAPFALFRNTPVEELGENTLVLRIQPDEGVGLHFNAKVPGPTVQLDSVRMDFAYRDYFDAAPRTGYETLLYDCMLGDATLFQRADNVEAGWRIVQPILASWKDSRERDVPVYPAGSDGPDAAAELLTRDGRMWRPIA